VELIRRSHGARAYGIVYPLITKSDGTKFGKTEGGAIWLDSKRTSPYKFYQFWYNTDDDDVLRYLKFFTFLDQSEIDDLAQATAIHPEQRAAQQRLAREMTRTLHGETALARAEEASHALFGGSLAGLSAADVEDIFDDVPASTLPGSEFGGEGVGLVDLLARIGMVASRGEARRLLAGGGVYLNNVQIADTAHRVALPDAIDGRFLVLRKRRRAYHLVRIEGHS
jgi:tyrosyl-tRNA synthetase